MTFHPGNLQGKRLGRASDQAYAPPRRRPAGDGVDPHAYDRDSRRVLLVALSARDCCWPVNDPERGGTFLFCGEAAAEGRAYCPHHGRRAVGAGTESERAAHRVLLRSTMPPARTRGGV